jgi:hypothetical protein
MFIRETDRNAAASQSFPPRCGPVLERKMEPVEAMKHGIVMPQSNGFQIRWQAAKAADISAGDEVTSLKLLRKSPISAGK